MERTGHLAGPAPSAGRHVKTYTLAHSTTGVGLPIRCGLIHSFCHGLGLFSERQNFKQNCLIPNTRDPTPVTSCQNRYPQKRYHFSTLKIGHNANRVGSRRGSLFRKSHQKGAGLQFLPPFAMIYIPGSCFSLLKVCVKGGCFPSVFMGAISVRNPFVKEFVCYFKNFFLRIYCK